MGSRTYWLSNDGCVMHAYIVHVEIAISHLAQRAHEDDSQLDRRIGEQGTENSSKWIVKTAVSSSKTVDSGAYQTQKVYCKTTKESAQTFSALSSLGIQRTFRPLERACRVPPGDGGGPSTMRLRCSRITHGGGIHSQNTVRVSC